LLITLSITAYVIVVVIPSRLAQRSYDGAKQIGHDIATLFQVTPRITVNHTVVLQQQTPVLELATLRQTFQHQYEWTNTWLGSTKKIMITGSFSAKAGVDLNKTFSINITDDKAVVTLPAPQLLSLESAGDVQLRDESGIINWVHAEDRAKAMNAFSRDARKYADQAAFVTQAREEMEKKLTEILRRHGKEVEIRYSPATRIQAY
jgi:hypothetical protein